MQYAHTSYLNMVESMKYNDTEASTDFIMHEIGQLVINRPVAVADALRLAEIKVSKVPSSSELVDKIFDNLSNETLQRELGSLIDAKYGIVKKDKQLNVIPPELMGAMADGSVKIIDGVFKIVGGSQISKAKRAELQSLILTQHFDKQKDKKKIMFYAFGFLALALTALVIYKLKSGKNLQIKTV